MSVFTPIIPIPAPEVAAANFVVVDSNQTLAMDVARYTAEYNAVWANKATTPDKVVTAMGTQAQAIFTKASARAAHLVAMGAVGIPMTIPSGWTMTENTDGSITAVKAQ